MADALSGWLQRLLAAFSRPTHPDSASPAPAALAPAQHVVGTIRQPEGVVDTIWIHCAATRPQWMAGHTLAAKVEEIRRWHIALNWRDIGYHWIIDRDGQIAPGRPETVKGSHVRGYNDRSLGICLIGGHGSNATDRFEDHFTPQQKTALRHLISDIKSRTPIRAVRGHNEVAAKACPGFHVDQEDWM